MAEKTEISWCDSTFNPWIGCTKVSPGCANCYAENTTRARVLRSQGHETWGKGAKRSRTSAATWRNPLKWNLKATGGNCVQCGQFYVGPTWKAIEANQFTCHGSKVEWHRSRIFPSLCDWLDDEVPIEWLADFLKLIHDTPNLDWLLLTKRPENFFRRLEVIATKRNAGDCGMEYGQISQWVSLWLGNTGLGQRTPVNVWIGTSVEDQKRADERIPELLKIPAKVRFLSVEPLLGAVDLAYTCFNGADSFGTMPGIHWIIVGGESGPSARPCNVQWIRSIVRQCKAAGVPCFVKQLGSKPVSVYQPSDETDMCTVSLTLKHKKGGDPAAWPEDLRVREFPTV